jgi:hypothetical protein
MNLKSFKNSDKGGIKCNKLISKIWKKGVTIKQFKKNFGQNIKKNTKSHSDILQCWEHIYMLSIFDKNLLQKIEMKGTKPKGMLKILTPLAGQQNLARRTNPRTKLNGT